MRVEGLHEPEACGLRTPVRPSLPAGLRLHFHAVPPAFHQRRMRAWGRASVQKPLFELCREKDQVRRLWGGRCTQRGPSREAGAEKAAGTSLEY